MGEPFDRAEVDRLVLGAAALMEELLDEGAEISRTHRLALAAQRRSHALERFHADQLRLWRYVVGALDRRDPELVRAAVEAVEKEIRAEFKRRSRME